MDVDKRLAADARILDAQVSRVNFDRLLKEIMAAVDALDDSNDPASDDGSGTASFRSGRARPGPVKTGRSVNRDWGDRSRKAEETGR
ncbi:hypothetical protein AB0M12_40195 [Nocardia vinacea]|uniref:hypothetical protein n=1 Tax=Nocardia vinacea TaxID=96468 RepID=UPI00342DAC57